MEAVKGGRGRCVGAAAGNVPTVAGARILRELKRDTFGRVELLECSDGTRVIRRVVPRGFVLGWAARKLARREARALEVLEGSGVVGAVPSLDEATIAEARVTPDGARSRDVFVRHFVDGEPLHRATELPHDFFDLLEDLTRRMHEHGVCHNDLHKEQNVMVRADGRPALIDFQLATLHRGLPERGLRGRWFTARRRDDMRHLQKHRRRYTRDGRGPEELRVADTERMPRRGIALWWMRTVKPVYRFVTRRVLRTRDGEERRPSTGPWPTWGPPIGPDRLP